jgi:hypothetical protein
MVISCRVRFVAPQPWSCGLTPQRSLMSRLKGIVWLPPHRRNREGRPSIGPYPALGGATARMTQPVERAIHVGYEKLYILLEGCRYDQAPIDILANMSHGTHFHHQQRCRSAAPPRKFEVRNNNVCEVLSRTARTDTVNLDLSQCGNRTSEERRLPRRSHRGSPRRAASPGLGRPGRTQARSRRRGECCAPDTSRSRSACSG